MFIIFLFLTTTSSVVRMCLWVFTKLLILMRTFLQNMDAARKDENVPLMQMQLSNTSLMVKFILLSQYQIFKSSVINLICDKGKSKERVHEMLKLTPLECMFFSAFVYIIQRASSRSVYCNDFLYKAWRINPALGLEWKITTKMFWIRSYISFLAQLSLYLWYTLKSNMMHMPVTNLFTCS